MVLDNKEFGIKYWTPPEGLAAEDWPSWYANKMAIFVDELASLLAMGGGAPTLNPEAADRLYDSLSGKEGHGLSHNILTGNLVGDELAKNGEEDAPRPD